MNSIIQKPWGYYLTLERGDKYLVKNITVNPGGKLSLQSHKYRSEHWVVVEGIATVLLDGNKSTLEPRDSIVIPKGAKHRLENHNKENLTIIEIQYGEILKEEDIIRYEDIYNRK